MPKVTIQVDPNLPPLSLQYSFTYDLSPSDQAQGHHDFRLYTVPTHTNITYAIKFAPVPAPVPAPAAARGINIGRRVPPPAPPAPAPPAPAEFLWITGIKISFVGRIAASMGQNLGDWKAGIIQSIYKSERNSRYQDGSVRKFRFNTAFGPLKDGEPKTPFYGKGPQKCTNGNWTVEEDDAPSFRVPAQFGPNNSKLTETFGMDCFCSFLVLAREGDKSIIELSRIKWQVNWDGDFDQHYPLWNAHGVRDGAGKWSPRDNASFLEVVQSNNPKLYATLNRQPVQVPFSLHMAEAENFSEILQNGQWTPCSAGGNTAKPGIRSLRSWRTSP